MPKKNRQATTSPSEPATAADIPSPTANPEIIQPAHTATPEERLAKIELDVNRLSQVVMQIVTVMEQQQKTGAGNQPIVNVQAPSAPAAGGFNLGSILPEIIKVAGNMMSPSQPAADPFQMEVYKGMVESFKEGFKSYIQTVNQNAQIGAEVVKAIQKGSLKLESGTTMP